MFPGAFGAFFVVGCMSIGLNVDGLVFCELWSGSCEEVERN